MAPKREIEKMTSFQSASGKSNSATPERLAASVTQFKS